MFIFAGELHDDIPTICKNGQFYALCNIATHMIKIVHSSMVTNVMIQHCRPPFCTTLFISDYVYQDALLQQQALIKSNKTFPYKELLPKLHMAAAPAIANLSNCPAKLAYPAMVKFRKKYPETPFFIFTRSN